MFNVHNVILLSAVVIFKERLKETKVFWLKMRQDCYNLTYKGGHVKPWAIIILTTCSRKKINAELIEHDDEHIENNKFLRNLSR